MKQLIINIAETEQEKRNHNDIHSFVGLDGKLTEEGKLLTDLAVQTLNFACFRNSDAHGWYEGLWLGTSDNEREALAQKNFGEVCALFTSEVSEAFEAYRDGDGVADPIKYGYNVEMTDGSSHYVFDERPEIDDAVGKPEGVAAELADVFIRIFDFAGAYGVPLAEAIIRKHNYNFTRPYRHGGKKA